LTKVLITGMSGLIGGLLRSHLEDVGGYELRALNRRPVEGVECFQADIGDLEAIKPAFASQDVVVHLAAQVKDEPWEGMARANLIGVFNVYEAARLAGVSRVVFASSGAATLGWERVAPYDAIVSGRYADVPESWPMITHEMVRPQGTYGASKVWGEALGRHFSDASGLSVLCIRFGHVVAENRPLSDSDYSRFLSHRDAVDILQRCIEAPAELRFDIFYATSNNKWGYRDLGHSREVLGYEPRDSAEAFR
jgi:nucleoside-diphosphate-sugar epimerase